MRIQSLSLCPYEIPLKTGQMRSGVLVNIKDEKGNEGWGDVAPLSYRSEETLKDCLEQLKLRLSEIIEINWTAKNCLQELEKLNLLPAVSFGLESALLAILSPLPSYSISTSALLMGSKEEILNQAIVRRYEGHTSAKLKVSNLEFEEATEIIHELKDKFRLRIDVNRAWNTKDSLRFFANFPLNTFDYVEEPFQNPNDLKEFPHPLAVDESFPKDLSLEQLESLPTLKALIYKPTIQGGLLKCLPLHDWTTKRGVLLVLSSSFESDLGLGAIASIAYRLSISVPIGIGTYDHQNHYLCANPLKFSHSNAHIPSELIPIKGFENYNDKA